MKFVQNFIRFQPRLTSGSFGNKVHFKIAQEIVYDIDTHIEIGIISFAFSFAFSLLKIPKRQELNYSQRQIKFYLYDVGRTLKYESEMFGRFRQTIENVNECHQKSLRMW